MRPHPLPIDALAPHLRRTAHAVGRYFPGYIMDTDDLEQEGWIGVLSVKERVGEEEGEFIARCRTAAHRKAINALRHIRETNPKRVKTIKSLHLLVEDIEQFDKSVFTEEKECIDRLDFATFTKNLSLREKTLLWAFMAGYAQAEIAAMLNITEGRVCQMKQGIFAYLRKMHQTK